MFKSLLYLEIKSVSCCDSSKWNQGVDILICTFKVGQEFEAHRHLRLLKNLLHDSGKFST